MKKKRSYGENVRLINGGQCCKAIRWFSKALVNTSIEKLQLQTIESLSYSTHLSLKARMNLNVQRKPWTDYMTSEL